MFRDAIRSILPHGIVAAHQRKFVLDRLGLTDSAELQAAVNGCRYDLWPSFLRRGAPDWTLVDVGANDGGFLSSTLSLVSPREIFVFEPLPACQAPLQALVKSHKKAHVFACAVGASSGEIEINCTADSKMSSALQPASNISELYQAGDFEVLQRHKVPMMRLDDAIPDDIAVDLLKIDVQGFELEVFRGAEKVLKRTKAVLLEVNYVEHYEGGALFDSVYRELRSKGFRVFGISAPYGGGRGGPLWADAMFVSQ